MRPSDPVGHLKSHLSKENLELMRNIALTTAGFSAGIIILLSQLHGSSASYSAVALWASIFSLVAWLFGFQYINAYLLHGEHVYKHINMQVAAGISLVGYLSLFTAVVATVWQMSVCAGIALIILGVALAATIVVHTRAVERHCNASGA
jgi:hypothetical protein